MVERREAKVTITKYPITDRNLKRYFGLPPINEMLNEAHGDRWLDHFYMRRRNVENGVASFNQVEFISEPYDLVPEAAKYVIDLCEKLKLNLVFSGGAEHNSGCFRIMIWRDDN